MPTELSADLIADLALVGRLAAVPPLLSVCLRASGMGVVAVARVTADRWIACAVLDRMGFGLVPGGELPVDATLCRVVRDARQPIVIEHASREAQWCNHPTPRTFGYESHVSVPILLPDGSVFGTLVAIDPKPLSVRAPDTVATFTLLADLLGHQIDAQRRLEAGERALAAEREEAALREQFVAVLGHDLRNPLAAIDAGVRLLGRDAGPQAASLLTLMKASVARMGGLVDDVLDFARGRLGDGLPTAMADGADLGAPLRQIVGELRAIHPHRRIDVDLDLGPVRADPQRIGQMVSNLVANALAHGSQDGPVRVEAAIRDGHMTLTVSNGGAPIPSEALADLFRPFRRGPGAAGGGLGLGLYIANEIARSHGGSLRAESGLEGTRLTFTMPTGAPRRETAA